MTDDEALGWLRALRRLRAIEAEQKRHIAILERALKNRQSAASVASQHAGHVEALLTDRPAAPYVSAHHVAGGPDATVERCERRIAFVSDEPSEPEEPARTPSVPEDVVGSLEALAADIGRERERVNRELTHDGPPFDVVDTLETIHNRVAAIATRLRGSR